MLSGASQVAVHRICPPAPLVWVASLGKPAGTCCQNMQHPSVPVKSLVGNGFSCLHSCHTVTVFFIIHTGSINIVVITRAHLLNTTLCVSPLQADVYSLGVTLYEMVERQRAFADLDGMQIWAAWIADPAQMALPPLTMPQHAGRLLRRAGVRVIETG